jgi:hypothetical protein
MANLPLSDFSYARLDQYLGGRQERAFGHNTRLERNAGGISVVSHGTAIATVMPDNDVVLRSGGWATDTTVDRINQVIRRDSGWGIGLHKGALVLYNWRTRVPGSKKDQTVPFREGITVNLRTGAISGGGAERRKHPAGRAERRAQYHTHPAHPYSHLASTVHRRK